jgi:RNase H-fold protein (predicted Holliday junction resolvase)
MKIEIIPLVISLVPATLITLLAIYFFKLHTTNEERRRRFLLHRENQKQSLPLRLQAYERLVLFLERISPGKLLTRTTPVGVDKKNYESLLVHTIDQEFEHNLTQQIYVSDECWNTLKASKNATIALIRKTALKEDVDSATKMREVILTELIEKGAPSDAAIAIIKEEISDLF